MCLFITKKENALPNRKVLVDGAGVYIADVDLGNGVMHDINRVLMPPAGTVVDLVIANPDLTYLVAAVLRASQGSTNVLEVLNFQDSLPKVTNVLMNCLCCKPSWY